MASGKAQYQEAVVHEGNCGLGLDRANQLKQKRRYVAQQLHSDIKKYVSSLGVVPPPSSHGSF
jgi:hypothetical protein